MRGRGIRTDQRGVSEIYGTVLVVTIAFGIALFLLGTGWVVIGQLTTESTDSLAEDSMRNVDREIDGIVDGPVSESTTLLFPEDSGSDVTAVETEGTFNLSVRTSDDDLWNTTVAKHEGWNQSNSTEVDMGTIEHDSERRGITAYQGGGLWRQPTRDSGTQILSEPNVDYAGNSLDVGIVKLSNVEAITEGSEVRIRKSDRATTKKEWEQFMSKYWTNRYNPSVSVPVDVNVTIESRFADGWAKYARERMTRQPETVIYPYNGDENTVKIVFGKIGNPPVNETDPEFGDGNILYAGSSDLAYKYHNDSVDGDIKGNATQFKETNLSTSDYEVALYTNEGEWIRYESGSSTWKDAENNNVNESNIEAINTSRGGPTGVSSGRYHIDPPAWLDNSSAAPVCVVTNTSGADVTDYIDDEGEDCLETMVGLDASLVDPMRGVPDLDVSFENGNFEKSYYLDEKIQSSNLEVKVKNAGTAPGARPLGLYAINESNYGTDFKEGIYLNGTTASNYTVDAKDSTTFSFEVPISDIQNRTAHSIVGENWTVFATLGGPKTAVPASNASDWTTVENFTVTRRDSQFEVETFEPTTNSTEVGETHRVDVLINETANETSKTVTQQVELRADGRLVNTTQVGIEGGNDQSLELAWEPLNDDVGNVTLNVSTFDDSNETTVEVTEPEPPEATFEVEILGTNSSIEEGQNLTVDANITNTGNVPAQKDVILEDVPGDPVDTAAISLNPGQSTIETFTWQTVFGDNGTGTVEVVTPDDADTTSVEITEIEREPRDPVDVMFVLDKSGSMSSPACGSCNQSRAEAAVDAAQGAIGNLNESKDRAGAVFFWHSKALKHGLSSDFESVNNSIAGLSPGGGTRPHGGLSVARNHVDSESNASREKVLVFMSDGATDGCKEDKDELINDDPRDCDSDGDDPTNTWALNEVEQANNSGMKVYSVGYGKTEGDPGTIKIDVAFQKAVAEVGGGKYYPAKDDEQLAEAFKDIIKKVTEPETPAFEVVDIVNTNDPVPAGERINMTATIKNTGVEGKSIVSLLDHNSSYVDSETLTLEEDETTNVTLEWDTTGVSPGNKEVTVKTATNQKNTHVEILGPKSGPELTITNVSKTADPAAGETIEVRPTIENVGSEDASDSTVLLTVIDNATGETIASDDTDIGTELSAGETVTPTLTWDTEPSDAGDYRLKVEIVGYSETETENVTVDEPSTKLDLAIVNTDDPVRAGAGTLNVSVKVENNENNEVTTTVLLNNTNRDVGIAPNKEIPANNNETVTIEWVTREGDGSPLPITIEARFANYVGSDTTQVDIEPGTSNVNYGAMSEPANPLDINLEEIEIDT